MSGTVSPEVTARLALGETVLLHHRADPRVFRVWARSALLALTVFLALVAGMIVATAHDAPPLAKVVPLVASLLILGTTAIALHLLGSRLPQFDAIATQRRLLWTNGAELTFVPGLLATGIGPVVSIQHRLHTYRLCFPANRSETTATLNRILIAASKTGGLHD